MKATHLQAELKAELMKEFEAEVDQLLASCDRGPLTMTQIEDLVLAARQRVGQKLAEHVLALQEQSHSAGAPVSAETGQRLRAKGKKSHGNDAAGRSDL